MVLWFSLFLTSWMYLRRWKMLMENILFKPRGISRGMTFLGWRQGHRKWLKLVHRYFWMLCLFVVTGTCWSRYLACRQGKSFSNNKIPFWTQLHHNVIIGYIDLQQYLRTTVYVNFASAVYTSEHSIFCYIGFV